MEIQKTLKDYEKTKRVDSEHCSYKNCLINNTCNINSCISTNGIIKKPCEKLLLIDSFQMKSIEKQKMESDVPQMSSHGNINETNAINAVIDNILDETKVKNNEIIESESVITPEQSPSTKAQLRKKLDLGEFHKMIYRKQNITRFQEEHNLVEQYENEKKIMESKIDSIENYCLYSFESVDFLVNTSPIKCELSFMKPTQLIPTTLFSSPLINPRKLMVCTRPSLSKKNALPRKRIAEKRSILAILHSKQNAALQDTKQLKLPLKYQILNTLFKAMETVSCKMFMRKEKNTFHKLKHSVQQMTKKNFTEFHLAQIKTIVPDFYKFSLVKLSNDGSVYDLVITSVYGSTNDNNIDFIKLTSRRKKTFFNALIDIVKEHHKEYLSKLIPPILMNKDKITRWHKKFNIDSVPSINPSSLPKIEIGLSKAVTFKNLDQTYTLDMYNNCSINEIKLSIIDSNSGLKENLRSFPTSCLSKIQSNQTEKSNLLMTRSGHQLEENKMINKLLDIAKRIYSYFVQLQRNVLPLKKLIVQLKQSYPLAITNEDWKAHLNILRKKVPNWILSKVLNGTEYIRINKKVEFKEILIKRFKK